MVVFFSFSVFGFVTGYFFVFVFSCRFSFSTLFFVFVFCFFHVRLRLLFSLWFSISNLFCVFFPFSVFAFKLVGDGECTVFVKVLTAKDRWARTGWCFETLCHGDEERKAVLERISPPKKEVTKSRSFILLF